MNSKLNITNKKQQIWARRKTTIDVEKPPGLSRSYSFDSILSRTRVVDAQDDPSLPPYDTIENYISPRPKYLRFNPDRHSEILARQENVTRLIKGMSFDCGVLFLDVESSDDCSVEDTEDLVKESLVSTHDESEGEKEEFQDGFSLMKWDTKDLKLSSYELVKMQHGHTTKVTEIEILGADLGQNDGNNDETDKIRNPRSLTKEETESRRSEPEKESYIQILGAVLGQKDVAEESAIVKPTVEEDDSTNNDPYDTETEGIKDTDTLLVTTSAHKNEVSEESSSSVGSGSIYSESSKFERSSGYSSSPRSFTVEKMIVKKQ
ncbi:hypothetical protein Tco_1160586, partial [Tanacetum coccineum]